jgi:hypothetical protein|tara:strand:- start:79 stop:309 length:231 start_codon:yes stop_codon:yes gene_type:complete
MKNLIEKQILEWKEELNKQVKIRDNAQQVLAQSNKTILMLEGGIQGKESLLRKIEQESQPTNKEDTKQESETSQQK